MEREKFIDLNKKTYDADLAAHFATEPNIQMMGRLAVTKALQLERPTTTSPHEIHLHKCTTGIHGLQNNTLGGLGQPIAHVNRDIWKPDARVLDFACGVGLISQELIPHVGSLVGLDISQDMADQYAARVPESKGVAHVVDILSDENLQANNDLLGTFDNAICSMSYHHIPELDVVTMRLVDRLRPGGWLAVIDFDGEGFHPRTSDTQDVKHAKRIEQQGVAHFQFERTELAKIFRRAGLTNICVEYGIEFHQWLKNPATINRMFTPEQLETAPFQIKGGVKEYEKKVKLAVTIGQKPFMENE